MACRGGGCCRSSRASAVTQPSSGSASWAACRNCSASVRYPDLRLRSAMTLGSPDTGSLPGASSSGIFKAARTRLASADIGALEHPLEQRHGPRLLVPDQVEEAHLRAGEQVVRRLLENRAEFALGLGLLFHRQQQKRQLAAQLDVAADRARAPGGTRRHKDSARAAARAPPPAPWARRPGTRPAARRWHPPRRFSAFQTRPRSSSVCLRLAASPRPAR